MVMKVGCDQPVTVPSFVQMFCNVPTDNAYIAVTETPGAKKMEMLCQTSHHC